MEYNKEILFAKIAELEKNIEKYKKKISNNKEATKNADACRDMARKLIQSIDNQISDYICIRKKKVNNLNQYNQYGKKYLNDLNRICKSSSASQIIDRLENDTVKSKKITENHQKEIAAWEVEVEKMEEELERCKKKIQEMEV